MWKELKKRFSSPDSYVSLILGFAVVLVMGLTAINYISKKRQAVAPAAKTEQEQKQEQVAGLPTTYAVKAGDTLWSIAETYYKSGYNWVDIQKANNLTNTDAIQVGQQLTIPQAAAITVPGQISATQTEAAKPKEGSYEIVHGDTLWSIAVKQYNDGYKWVNIAKANGLTNPDLIHAGNVLTLPTIQ